MLVRSRNGLVRAAKRVSSAHHAATITRTSQLCIHHSNNRTLHNTSILSFNESTSQPTTQSTAQSTSRARLPSPEAVKTALQHCIQQVKENDPSTYLSTLFTPPLNQSVTFAFHALRIELAKIRKQALNHSGKQANDSRIAAMKFAWWTTNIRALFNQSSNQSEQPAAHPILTVLTALLVQRNQAINQAISQSANQSTNQSNNQAMIQRYMIRLVDSQEDLLEHMQSTSQSLTRLNSTTELDSLFESTESTILYLIGQFVLVDRLMDRIVDRSNVDHILSHVGKAVGMVSLLRSENQSIKHTIDHSALIPQELIDAHHINQSDDQSNDHQADYQALVFDLAKVAKAHLHHARDLFEQEFNQPINQAIHQSTQQINDIISSKPSNNQPVNQSIKQSIKQQVASICLPAVTADRWLDQLEEHNFDVDSLIESGHHRYRLEPIKLRYALWKHSKAGTF